MAEFDELKIRRRGSVIFGPIKVPSGMERVVFTTDIDPADAVNEALSIFLSMEISLDGTTWVKWGGFGWFGKLDFTGIPSCSLGTPPAGVQARLVLDVPQEINIGVKVSWRALKIGEVAG